MLRALSIGVTSGVLFTLSASGALAHCDTLDGPVVAAARAALESERLVPVLIWVQPEHEAEVAEAFESALDVRGLGASASELADRYFFETVVRLHREGEGAPYTGLKPAGADRLAPVIRATDTALESGSSEDLVALLESAVEAGTREHVSNALSKRDFDREDIAAGRAYVASYVELLHYVERIYDAATRAAPNHFPEHE